MQNLTGPLLNKVEIRSYTKRSLKYFARTHGHTK